MRLDDTVSEADVYQARPRICDLGYWREAYKTSGGGVGYRCSGEPVTTYVDKGGVAGDTAGRRCLCNSLMANVGLAQVRNGKHVEKGLITAGDDVAGLTRFLPGSGVASYSAADVVAALLAG